MTMLDPTTLAALRAAKEKATAGPWELENQYCLSASECAVHIIGPRSDVLFESSNSDTRETDYDADENGTTYYDVGSRANFAYIVLLVNSAAALLDAAEENVRLRKALEWYATTNAPEVARTALERTP